MSNVLHLKSSSARWTATVDGDRVLVDDVAFRVIEQGDGRIVVNASDGVIPAIWAAEGASIWIGLDGHAIEFRLERGDVTSPAATRDDDALRPPMSATVVRVNVTPGSRVEAGDTLVVLEAMKMELAIRAPRAGTIRAVHCQQGELVQPDVLLVEME
jgi:acetyl/propionyl-CoA carboxylase alpha subunit